jgi:hypothetical protein
VLEAERERRQPPDGVAVTVASDARGAEVHAPTPARAAESLNRLTQEHATAEARPGLFVISDTPTQTTRAIYEMPPPPAAGTLTLARVDTYSKLLLAGCVVAVLAMIANLVRDAIEGGLTSVWRDPFDGLAFVVPLLVTLLVIAAVVGGRRTVKRLLADVSGVVQTPWQFLRRLTVNDFFAMLLLRLGSLWALTNDIFMNRIRSMGYAYVFAQPSLESRILANEIFDLVGATSTPERPVSDAMRKIATDASTMGTALWLKEPPPDEPGELDLLIACGQMTTCYNLLERLARQAPSDETSRGLYARAREDWNAFLEDPYAFVQWRELRAGATYA